MNKKETPMKMKTMSVLLLAALTSTSALASSTANLYNCTVLKADAQSADNQKITITIDGEYLTTSEVEGSKFEESATYNPRLGNVNMVEFTGGSDGDGYAVEVLISKGMLKGAEKGSATFRARGEGYFSYRYSCQLN